MDHAPGIVPLVNMAAAPRRFFCALERAQSRLSRARRASLPQRRARAKRAAAVRVAEGHASCRLPALRPNASLLRASRLAADIVGCGGVRFARLLNGSSDSARLELDCPAWREPYYSLGLSARLHRYKGEPVPLPKRVEYVAAYCRFKGASSPACERVGREGKGSNAAALRRACPHLSHGWVLQPLVRNLKSETVLRRMRGVAARRRGGRAAAGAAAGGVEDGDGGVERGVDGGVEGGVDGGVEGGVEGGVDGGDEGGVDGGVEDGVEGGVDAGVEGGVEGGVDGGVDGGDEGAMSDAGEGEAAVPETTGASGGDGGGGGDGLDVSVLVLMLDSISAARFKEGMPLTHALLESWSHPGIDEEGWRAFRFDKFLSVGSNSPRNQLPLLTGLASLEYARDHGGV